MCVTVLNDLTGIVLGAHSVQGQWQKLLVLVCVTVLNDLTCMVLGAYCPRPVAETAGAGMCHCTE